METLKIINTLEKLKLNLRLCRRKFDVWQVWRIERMRIKILNSTILEWLTYESLK